MANGIYPFGKNLVPVNEVDLNIYLRRRDRESVQAVLDQITKVGAEPFLGGGTLTRHLSDGDKKYRDVDILGVVEDSLNPTYERLIETLKGEPNEFVCSSPIPQYVRLGGEVFSISNLWMRNTYCGSPVDHSFLLKPFDTYFGLEKATIDLSLVDKKRFNSRNFNSF